MPAMGWYTPDLPRTERDRREALTQRRGPDLPSAIRGTD